MNYASFYTNAAQAAFRHDAPGVWMPDLPDQCIRLSAGYPAPSLVPVDQFKEAVDSLIAVERDAPFQYMGSPQQSSLRRQIVRHLVHRGMHIQENEVLITAGSCQAIDLVAHTLLDRETVVAVEAPTYMEALEVFRNYTDCIIEVPIDSFGLRTDVLEELLCARRRAGMSLPRLLYTIPSFHNPSGTTMTLERRERLLKLAEEYHFLILEDDAYGELAFTPSPVPLKALDKKGCVIHIGSLSKVVAPGLRIGWTAGPEALISAIGWFKKDLDHPFAQAAMATFLQRIDLDERLGMLRRAYQGRRDTMLSALKCYMPESVTWDTPEGGFFVWLRLSDCDTSLMLKQALQAGVSYVPGKHFFNHSHEKCGCLRLSFSYVEPSMMVEGIQRLAEVIKADGNNQA